CVRVQSYFDYW
nr:immunoglobulin heavy chain junction region [Macaca mulatta]MOV50429.1 immunoglobulin heavy chain junction region [Macaca mulatta]MOV50864.1 immunoglobulin heavy chain junction region [Macaca mulatta]MOV51497.1 immunoglobulin heavy chain junction region [Macaca mulatta]MOV51748.1 immunoglobulin heavy chain junction region [Macaca mulatta]